MSSVLVAEAYIWSLGFNIQRYLEDQEESKCATQKFHLHQTPPRNQTNTRLKIGITKLSQMTNNHSWFENVTHSVKSERITFWRRQCSKNPKTQTWSMCLLKRLQCCLLTTFLCKCHAFVRLQSQLSPFHLFTAPNWKSFSAAAEINALLTKSISKPTLAFSPKNYVLNSKRDI